MFCSLFRTVIGLVAYGVIKLQNRIRRRLKAKQDAVVLGKNYDKLCKYQFAYRFEAGSRAQLSAQCALAAIREERKYRALYRDSPARELALGWQVRQENARAVSTKDLPLTFRLNFKQ